MNYTRKIAKIINKNKKELLNNKDEEYKFTKDLIVGNKASMDAIL